MFKAKHRPTKSRLKFQVSSFYLKQEDFFLHKVLNVSFQALSESIFPYRVFHKVKSRSAHMKSHAEQEKKAAALRQKEEEEKAAAQARARKVAAAAAAAAAAHQGGEGDGAAQQAEISSQEDSSEGEDDDDEDWH